jgi:hypothetical protein
MGADGSNPALNDFRNLAASFRDLIFSNLIAFGVLRNPYVSGFVFTFNDFKLTKDVSLISNKLEFKERTFKLTK